jgi:hypothetical protein
MQIQLTLDLSTFKPNQTEALIEFVRKFTTPYCVPTPDFEDPESDDYVPLITEQARG